MDAAAVDTMAMDAMAADAMATDATCVMIVNAMAMVTVQKDAKDAMAVDATAVDAMAMHENGYGTPLENNESITCPISFEHHENDENIKL